jgi:hypothetical protein
LVWNEIAAHVYQLMGKPERVIDPGAGRCEFINAIPAPERWIVDLLDYCEYRDSGVKVIHGSILDAELPRDYFDGVFISNVLEHLPSQEAVGQLLRRLWDAMEPGGTLAIMGPNFRFCAGEYFDCADHTLALTHVAIAEHVHAAGFSMRRVIPRFLPYSFRGVLPPSPLLTKIYLRIPVLWRLLGKQFLVIGVKAAPGERKPC